MSDLEDSDSYTEEDESLIEALGDMVVPQAILLSDIAFSNPLRPQYCAQLLHGAWFRMFASADEGALPAAFHFIVFGRTESQMTNLVDGLSRCHCAPDDPPDSPEDKLESVWIDVFHDIGVEALVETTAHGGVQFGTAPTHFHSLMNIMSIRILQILKRTNPVKLAKLKARQEWPASLNDIILPSVGPETIVKSLEQWTRRMSHDYLWPIELLGTIGSICRSLVFPAIVDSPTLIPTIVRIARGICDDAAPHLSPRSPRAKIIETADRFLWRLRFITAFFHSIFSNAGGSPDMLDNFPVERKTAVVQMCGRVIEMLRLPLVVQHAPRDVRIGLIEDFTGNLTMFIDVGVSTEGVDPALVKEAIETHDRVHGPPLTLIRPLLLGWKASMRCYANACEESLQTSHGAFQRCSSCKIASYCGKECQRRAWRDHKPLCKTITKIIQDGGGDLHSEAFAQSCEAGKVDARDAEQIVTAFGLWRRSHGRVSL